MGTVRQESLSTRLARLGFAHPARAEQVLADLDRRPPPVDREPVDGGAAGSGGVADEVERIADCADPDLALSGYARLLRASDGPGRSRLLSDLATEDGWARRLFAVLGASAALGDHLVRHPEHVGALATDTLPDAGQLRRNLLGAVGADPDAALPVATVPAEEGTDALRVAYRRHLLVVTAHDVAADEPLAVVPAVAAHLSDLAAAALEAALALARAQVPSAEGCRFAVIGMGKCGGRELNYVSDVDVVYVVEPAEPAERTATRNGRPDPATAAALETGRKLAVALARVCSASTAEGTLWPIDANLRPEGAHGPLVRTLASHAAYLERWAQTWEFQALLKARPVAGDAELGQRYLDLVQPLVWSACQRPGFVEDVQAMRRRVEAQVRGPDADRQLKLGPGGLRDVEFSVQLLQLVHGRADPRLRSPNTWTALEALSTYGYVGRADAAQMDSAYRMLRALEHRIQLVRLRRTHVVPVEEDELRSLGRGFGFRTDPARQLTDTWRRHALEVRRLHEKLFYRPLLSVAARLDTDEARLSAEAASARLAALGFRDPQGAMRHLAALTAGVSRRAAIQRQLLPVMLGWFAEGADPDAGLLAFRRLSDTLGSTHWYLKTLRDSGAGAERLAHVLSSGALAADLLQRGPEAVAMLASDEALRPLPLESMIESVRLGAARHEGDPEGAAIAARAVRRREIVRTAIADVALLVDVREVGRSLSDAAVAALDGALVAAASVVAARYGGQLPAWLAVIAVGRLGGRELNYGSDADVLFVYRPRDGAASQEAQEAAMATAAQVRRLLTMTGPEPGLAVDAGLRPEGRHGALVRSLDSYAEYYARWSVPWEAQALLRALPVAGEVDLGRRWLDLVDPLRYPKGGPGDAAEREIRRIKSRVEAERLPRGADPHRHLKLGRGALADVEWTVQLLQLRHAWEVPGMRTTTTLGALEAAAAADVVDRADAEALSRAWRFASRLRNAVTLWRGRMSDVPPTNYRDLDGVARLIGYPPASAGRLDDDYQRVTRRARAVVERLFYG